MLNQKKYTPKTAVWELTYQCNMQCKHCGSSCGVPLANEMPIDRALLLCDELAKLGVTFVTLSGGEPFLSSHWYEIASRLTQNKIMTNIITNGSLITDDLLDKITQSDISNVCVSIDGYQDAHDFMRRPGSYETNLKALQLMQEKKVPSACITSVNKKTLVDLPKLKADLNKYGVERWQIQVAMPMGNLLQHKALLLDPEDMPKLMEFCYQTMQEKQIILHMGDNLGYFSNQYKAVVQYCNSSYSAGCTSCHWRGCQAGKKNLGIRADGKIYGCLALRDEKYCAGDVCQSSLADIWNNDENFAWNRTLKKEDLLGFCQKCKYGSDCLGGCSAQKLTFSDSINAENKNCLYKLETETLTKDVAQLTDINALIDKANTFITLKNYQAAEIYLSKALTLKPDDPYLSSLAGFVHYFLKNYSLSLQFNEHVLALDPHDAYALRGKGLCLCQLGNKKQGLEMLYQAMGNAKPNCFDDICYDLVITLINDNNYAEAKRILDSARAKSETFKNSSEKLYQTCLRSLE